MDISTYHGETPLILQGPDIGEARPGDLDTITYEVLTSSDYLGDLDTLGFVKGQPVTEETFHAVTLQSIRVLRESDHLRLLSLTCTGIITDLALDPAANSLRTFDPTPVTETFTTPEGFAVLRRTYQPTLTHIYYTTEEPDTAAIGDILAVENPPACPAARVIYRAATPDFDNPGQYISFGEYPQVTVTGYENEWVLENRIPEVIFQTGDTGLWKVTDTIVLTTVILQIGEAVSG
jgi:hypothetical protein